MTSVTRSAQRVFNWLARLDLAPLITHILPLTSIEDALRIAGRGDSGKVLLQP
jgi:NADPH:quinone reductase-like Zn-dependent oxidoreductase